MFYVSTPIFQKNWILYFCFCFVSIFLKIYIRRAWTCLVQNQNSNSQKQKYDNLTLHIILKTISGYKSFGTVASWVGRMMHIRSAGFQVWIVGIFQICGFATIPNLDLPQLAVNLRRNLRRSGSNLIWTQESTLGNARKSRKSGSESNLI